MFYVFVFEFPRNCRKCQIVSVVIDCRHRACYHLVRGWIIFFNRTSRKSKFLSNITLKCSILRSSSMPANIYHLYLIISDDGYFVFVSCDALLFNFLSIFKVWKDGFFTYKQHVSNKAREQGMFYGINKPEISQPKIKIRDWRYIFLFTNILIQHKINLLKIWRKIRKEFI